MYIHMYALYTLLQKIDLVYLLKLHYNILTHACPPLLQLLHASSGRRVEHCGEAKCKGLRLLKLIVDSTRERRRLSGSL